MAKRMGKGLVALSSTAIATVYGIGYAVTQPAAVSMAAGVTPSGPSSADVSAAPPMSSPATATAAAATLKDGTYKGTGWSRHGSVSVSVTVQGGRITAAPITGVTTRYSQNVIAGLPAKVVAAQGPRVNLVSGATDSSDAYVSAVAQALSQAGGTAASPAAPAAAGDPTTASPPPPGGVQVTGPNGTIYRNGGGRRTRGGYGYGD
jgi:uncharacterized protein with FMN-binding domain